MPFEVFSPFVTCSEAHGVHRSLREAAACYNEIVNRNGGALPLRNSTGKYIHSIGKVDRHGNQLDFTPSEKDQARRLSLPPEAVMFEGSGITTFYNIANMLYESSRLIPITGINLEGLFDYKLRNRHFWSTEAGLGQVISYAQQATFTVELSLKSLLEASGQLVNLPEKTWRTHDLKRLYDLLHKDYQQRLEDQWRALPISERAAYPTMLGFLKDARRFYMDWRYIPTLKSADQSMDVSALLSASRVALDLARRTLKEESPIKIEMTSWSSEETGQETVRSTVMVEGVVVSVSVESSFDPHSLAEVVIVPDWYWKDMEESRPSQNVIAQFRKSEVERYFGLQGRRVVVVGQSTDADPFTLQYAELREPTGREASYTVEARTLRGSIYNMVRHEDSNRRSIRVNLVLSDSTYFSDVDCLFHSKAELEMLNGVQLGSEVTISGQTTLLNGRPVSMMAPVLTVH